MLPPSTTRATPVSKVLLAMPVSLANWATSSAPKAQMVPKLLRVLRTALLE
jgi:hypothetical protein